MRVEFEIRAVQINSTEAISVPIDQHEELDRVDTVGLYYRVDGGPQYHIDDIDTELMYEVAKRIGE